AFSLTGMMHFAKLFLWVPLSKPSYEQVPQSTSLLKRSNKGLLLQLSRS
uniref:Uncharacterized protein n=1 Tax=Aegilops tauschii subsp. strangulata TaxID=200361 RepID=A0A453LSD6_AEGTS